MGFIDRLLGGKPESDDWYAEYQAQRRDEDPDYDERDRLHRENVELRKRRDMLATREENAALRQEIAELERREGVPPLDANGMEPAPDVSWVEFDTELSDLFKKRKWPWSGRR